MNKWKRILVDPTTSILDTIKIIDETALQIALVVGVNNRLLGTVTDGDIRRGILHSVPLSDNVAKIMNANPVTANISESRDEIIARMKARKIAHIPVLDASGCVVSLEVMQDILHIPRKANWVVLMAGGLGKRLSPLTDYCPKPLLKVGNKPILQTILENFVDQGFCKFFIAVNHRPELIEHHFGNGERWNVEIQYLRETTRLGTAGSLSLLPEKPQLPLIVMNGDLLTKINFNQLLQFHNQHKAQATMAVREYSFQVPYGVVKLDRFRLKAIEEKPLQEFFVSAGIYVLSPDMLAMVPSNTYFDMPTLFEATIRKDFVTAAFPIREYWLDIGRMEEYAQANDEYAEVFGK